MKIEANEKTLQLAFKAVHNREADTVATINDGTLTIATAFDGRSVCSVGYTADGKWVVARGPHGGVESPDILIAIGCYLDDADRNCAKAARAGFNLATALADAAHAAKIAEMQAEIDDLDSRLDAEYR